MALHIHFFGYDNKLFRTVDCLFSSGSAMVNQEGLLLQTCRLIYPRRPLCMPSHNSHQACCCQACCHQAKGNPHVTSLSSSFPPVPTQCLNNQGSENPMAPALFAGPGTLQSTPAFPHFRLHFPQHPQPSTCPCSSLG